MGWMHGSAETVARDITGIGTRKMMVTVAVVQCSDWSSYEGEANVLCVVC